MRGDRSLDRRGELLGRGRRKSLPGPHGLRVAGGLARQEEAIEEDPGGEAGAGEARGEAAAGSSHFREEADQLCGHGRADHEEKLTLKWN